MNTILALLALLVSCGLFVVHYRNQVERRHGEIVQLKVQLCVRLETLHQRLSSLLVQAELMRMELRRLPDCDSKFRLIEDFPENIRLITKLKAQVEGAIRGLNNADSQKINHSATLLALQSGNANFGPMIAEAERIEGMILTVLQRIRELALTAS